MADAKVNPNGKLKGRVALVTGASRGIGEAISTRLAMEGAKVVCTARTADDGQSTLPGTLKHTVKRIREAGGEANYLTCDLSKSDEREQLVKDATGLYGPIDILINNGAVTFYYPIESFPEKRFKLMIEVQVWAALHLSQLVLPAMRERKQGAIVTISSGAAWHPKQPYENLRAGGTVYGMCKAALERFSTGLASEVYNDNISVNVIAPGLVATPGVAVHGLITEKTKHRVSPIENIAEAVYILVSGDPKKMTGRIDNAAPFLEELGVTPAPLVGVAAG
jgi:NAD(P)-dependent dehydrogenase (short-subunit alcohol dehydrogenase family)